MCYIYANYFVHVRQLTRDSFVDITWKTTHYVKWLLEESRFSVKHRWRLSNYKSEHKSIFKYKTNAPNSKA